MTRLCNFVGFPLLDLAFDFNTDDVIAFHSSILASEQPGVASKKTFTMNTGKDGFPYLKIPSDVRLCSKTW